MVWEGRYCLVLVFGEHLQHLYSGLWKMIFKVVYYQFYLFYKKSNADVMSKHSALFLFFLVPAFGFKSVLELFSVVILFKKLSFGLSLVSAFFVLGTGILWFSFNNKHGEIIKEKPLLLGSVFYSKVISIIYFLLFWMFLLCTPHVTDILLEKNSF